MKILIKILLLGVLFNLLGCTAPVQTASPQQKMTLDDFPEQKYISAKNNNEPVYAVSTKESEVDIFVYRGGTFARMGHNHVVTSRDVHGFVLLAEDNDGIQADIYVPLNTLVVDEAEKRKQAGFDSTVSDKDINGTLRNMLDKVLESQTYPHVFIHVEAETNYRNQVVKADMTMHGVTRSYLVPVRISKKHDKLTAKGKMVIRHTDFGMQPFSVLGGALQVKDELILNFNIHADRL